MLFAFLRLVSVVTLLPMPADTPPAHRLPAPAPRELRAVDDVVLTARMADGSRAPANLVLPNLENRREVFAYLLANYPDTTRIGNPTVMPVAWVYVDESGVPHFPQLIVQSGAGVFDSLAIGMVQRARFAPAKVGDATVPVWVMLPVQLSRAPLARPDSPSDPNKPHFTPYTKKPELVNRDAVRRELVLSYPHELRSTGVGGTVQVWVHISEAGTVDRALVKQASSSKLLDEAALRVARIMVFTPAENRGRETAVWISLPIVFNAR